MAAEKKYQIPWAKDTVIAKVKDLGSGVADVEMVRGNAKASIGEYGDVELTLDSRSIIKDHLTKSDRLTRSLRKYLEKKEGWFEDNAVDWLEGEIFEEPMPWGKKKAGILDWWPQKRKVLRKRVGKKGRYEPGHVSDLTEHWVGTGFRFVHFRLPDDEEGLAIEWGNEVEPEVWLGNVEEFLSANIEDWESEGFSSYNDFFENGFLWALDLMGVFPGDAGETIPEWVMEMIAHNPDLMWPELVERLIPDLGQFPEDFDQAIRTWIERRRLEYEEAAGQQYFWPKGE